MGLGSSLLFFILTWRHTEMLLKTFIEIRSIFNTYAIAYF